MYEIYLALGTNLGDKKANLKLAIECLSGFVWDIRSSAFYESAPMYVEDQPSFVNMVVGGQTELTPLDLLDRLKDLEEEIGRRPTFRNGPRVIDLDILYHGDCLMTTERLSIPHISIQEREFVLLPLMDICPDRIDERTGKTVREMTEALPDTRGLIRLDD
ncbi:2-amino-4-hydroxy-6-hydroxymethyldihydropteridine diphosphokinase [Curvivirga aplysinae]|uniref:2-amino-4-hydroxy-6- hydroxymethyldihydropteridine diphosphokinase n=1 Tax=Curvivirga aplysinae TaxID=2529852 RepID=UPI0012BC7B4F|nr:2-amino-4-hydroxy-6-hydroxymethyldihydropteridine diphosphokinase [Curvivirga aplysinae]MTI10434.1 2-amino-4-hydroxy-6-hydroxymethyldihydropteridine diphosphokinase [Curvivirga aplysinae]